MGTHSYQKVIVNPAAKQVCPGCGGCTIVRSDTGLCERCTAKTPAAIAEWGAWRELCLIRTVRRSVGLPADYCMACLQPFGDFSAKGHEPYCTAKPIACDCGRRYINNSDLRQHQRKCQVPVNA